ncbi:MAG: OmpA family protein [Flavobacteriales bacterium]
MKKRTYFIFSILLVSCAEKFNLMDANNAQSKDQYHTAIHHYHKCDSTASEVKLGLACSYYHLNNMDKADYYFSQLDRNAISPENVWIMEDTKKQLAQKEENKRRSETIISPKVIPLNNSGSAMCPVYIGGELYYLSSKSLSENSGQEYPDSFLKLESEGKDAQNLRALTNGQFHAGPLAVDAKEQCIVFSKNVLSKEGNKSISTPALFEIKKIDGNWTEPVRLPWCEKGLIYTHPALTPDGQTLYFSSNRTGGSGGMDIFKAVKGGDGQWLTPVAVVQCNTKGDDVFPSVSKSGGFFFSSNRKDSFGGWDIYSLGAEGEITHLPEPINSERDDFSLYQANENTWLFSSSRGSQINKDQVYQFTYDPHLVQYILVDSVSKQTIKKASVQLANFRGEKRTIESDENGGIVISSDSLLAKVEGYEIFDLNGRKSNQIFDLSQVEVLLQPKAKDVIQLKVFDLVSLEPIEGAQVMWGKDSQWQKNVTNESGEINIPSTLEEINSIVVEKEGYFKQKIGVSALKIDLPYIVQLKKAEIGKDISKDLSLNPIYFDSNKSTLNQKAKVELDKVLLFMNDNPGYRLDCRSHTDCRSSKQYNLTLSNARAKSVMDYLKSKGIDPNRLESHGYGESQSTNGCDCEGKQKSTCSEEELAKNRRLEFVIIN